jgi:hypothetical protein
MIRPTEVTDFYLKNKNYYRLRRKFTRYTSELQTLDNNSSRQIVYNKIKEKEIKSRRRDHRRGVAG